jgi:hypothetical protein
MVSNFKRIVMFVITGVMSCLCGFAQDVAQTESNVEMLRKLDMIEASLAGTLAKLVFSAKFEFEGGWSDVFTTDVDDRFFSDQPNFDSMDRASGQLLVGSNCYRYDFNYKSPIHVRKESEKTLSTSWSTTHSSWANNILLEYNPHQQIATGGSIGEALHVVKISNEEFKYRNQKGAGYSPYFLSGFRTARLFDVLRNIPNLDINEERIDYPGFNIKVLKITASSSALPDFQCAWVFDDSQLPFCLLEIQRGSGDHIQVVKFLEFADLDCGARFPFCAVTATAYNLDGVIKFDIKRFRLYDFQEGEPERSKFSVSYSRGAKVYSYPSSRTGGELNPFEMDPAQVDDGSRKVAPTFNNAVGEQTNIGSPVISNPQAISAKDQKTGQTSVYLIGLLAALAVLVAMGIIRKIRK